MRRFFIVLFSSLLASASYAADITNPTPCSVFGTTSGTCLQGAGALGSPLSIGTLPAFTLGGTIAGGGNQLNNIIIGTTTPLAGTFTALTANTSVVSPIHSGGTAANSTLTLESTTGAGTTDSIIFKTASQTTRGTIETGGKWAIGSNAPIASATPLLDVNASAAATAFPDSANIPQIRELSSDGTGTIHALQTYGGTNAIYGYNAANTAASPQALGSGGQMLILRGVAYDGSVWGQGGTISAQIAAFLETSQAQTVSAHGTRFRFATTPNGTTSRVDAMYVQNDGGVSIGVDTNPGIGSLQVNANIFAPNIPTTTGALGAAVCYTATTGQFQRDTNAGGCLVSSERYKHDIEPLSASLDELMALKPVSFVYNDDVGVAGRQVGFLAEQTAAVDERLVGFNSDGSPQSVRYMQMTAVLVGAIQQLKTDNDVLRACQSNWKCRIFGASK